MKKSALLTLSFFALLTSAAFAWVGGPWSNNGFSPGAETGTYQAVATYSNGNGIMRFQVTNQASLSVDGNTSLWWYRGATYSGNTAAVVDLSSRLVTGINTASTLDSDAVFNEADVIDDSGKNVQRLTANWTAKIKKVAPQIRFEGKGKMQIFGNLDTGSTSRIFNVTYETGPVNDPEGNFLYTINQNSSNSTMNGSFGQDEDFPQLGKTVSIRVMGSRTSWLAPGNLAAGGSFVRTNGLLQVPGESSE